MTEERQEGHEWTKKKGIRTGKSVTLKHIQHTGSSSYDCVNPAQALN